MRSHALLNGIGATALAMTLALSTGADAKLTRTGTPQVAFHANGTGGLKLTGTTNDLEVDDQDTQVVIKVPLHNLTTGVGLRDHHMRDKYLQVSTYPDAVLTVPRSAVQLPTSDGNAAGDATGSMTIHGRTKNVPFHYKLVRTGSMVRVGGSTRLDIRDFGIAQPSYLGVKVYPTVDVDVQFSASEEAPRP